TYGLLTTFEVTTAMAFEYFRSRGVDFQVIETGLGGRLDATNVVDPEVSVITSISLDHTAVLGDTLAKIAVEKAGIIKRGKPVVSSPQPDEVDEVLERTCKKKGSNLIRVGQDVSWEYLGSKKERQSLRVKGRLGIYDLTIPLLGRHQLDNAAAAVAALEILEEKGFNVSAESIARGLAKVDWPGRLQVLSRQPLLVVDGAHNAESAARLRQALQEYFTFDRAILIIGVSADKDLSGIVSELAPVFDKVIATHSIHPRAMPEPELVAALQRYGIDAMATRDVPAALALARRLAGPGDLICVTGSLFVVAEAIEHVRQQVANERLQEP
ncbi:MAG: Mur ligase family protein, partial [Dehalococcoidales bacterium]|nr:Mur ligase family protein [Dehalococcoidales bacterium]